jgi:hypothetical protein
VITADNVDNYFSDLYGDQAAPLDSSTPASSSSGWSFGDIWKGVTSLGTQGVSAYKNFTQPTAAQTAKAKAQATAANYMPLIMLGGGILVVVVIIFALLRRGK